MSPSQVLLLTGANNHDWSRSAPLCRDLLESSGRFAVTLTESPAEALAGAEALARYQLFFLDYNGPAWGEPAQSNFTAAVAAGTGVLVLHAADNAFPGWEEYERLVGLLWRDGAGHGEFHEFPVTVRDHEHPITRGLDDFRTWDELYHRLAHMHEVPYHVLATAYSDPNRGGSGGDEPMMVVTQYGQGRVFHLVLGHVMAGASLVALESPQFQTALLRGCEWAATGAVAD